MISDMMQDELPEDDLRIPALAELPMIRVVHPAYHCLPNGGHGSFFPSANRRFNCDRVFATMKSF